MQVVYFEEHARLRFRVRLTPGDILGLQTGRFSLWQIEPKNSTTEYMVAVFNAEGVVNEDLSFRTKHFEHAVAKCDEINGAILLHRIDYK